MVSYEQHATFSPGHRKVAGPPAAPLTLYIPLAIAFTLWRHHKIMNVQQAVTGEGVKTSVQQSVPILRPREAGQNPNHQDQIESAQIRSIQEIAFNELHL